jgi:2,3-bisphosphoglycerate-independent phosphoglycerate mutase
MALEDVAGPIVQTILVLVFSVVKARTLPPLQLPTLINIFAVHHDTHGGLGLRARIMYVILDGVGDLPFPERGNRTPLEAASTPNLDKLTSNGKMGTLYTVKQGIAPESDAGVFSLLSYDPVKVDLSRGVVEAVGSGLKFKNGDLGLRCNFATVQDGQITDRRAGRNVSTAEAQELVGAVNENSKLRALADFELKATIGHRCALVFRAGRMSLSGYVSNLDPAYDRKGRVTIAKSGVTLPTPVPKCVPLNKTKAAAESAKLLNQFAAEIHNVLKHHPVNVRRRERGDLPANFLLMRDAGTKTPKVRTLKQKFGFKSVALADMPVELGIARVVGMDAEVFSPDRSLEGYRQRAQKALELTTKHDLVYVHLKGPDEPGHDGDFDGKRKSIEDIDAGFFSGLQALDSKLMCVTADHSTPCIAKGHSDDPVPILVTGLNIKADGSRRFTEAYGRKGALGTIMHGYEVLKMLKKLAR